jgi:hypothetical protein
MLVGPLDGINGIVGVDDDGRRKNVITDLLLL